MGLNGTISFKTNGGFKIPLTNSSDDALATQLAWDFNEGWFANPVFINGDYPEYLKDYVSTLGLNFTEQQTQLINGTADVFAHDGYTSSFYMAPDSGVAACVSNSSNTLFPGCFNTTNITPTGWNIGAICRPLYSLAQFRHRLGPCFLDVYTEDVAQRWYSGQRVRMVGTLRRAEDAEARYSLRPWTDGLLQELHGSNFDGSVGGS